MCVWRRDSDSSRRDPPRRDHRSDSDHCRDSHPPCARRSLTWPPVKGLFFRPASRKILSSLSLREGWRFYCSRLGPGDTNLEASSPSSYFGTSALAFAAR